MLIKRKHKYRGYSPRYFFARKERMMKNWSSYIQTTDELNESRGLRFTDKNKALWLDALAVLPGMRVLEVGCGGGMFCHRVKEFVPGVDVTGLDLDEGHIRRAKELFPECRFLVGNAAELPFPDGTFDLCFSHTVAEHIPHDAFFGEQLRVLKPGGRVSVLSVRPRLNIKSPVGCSDEEDALMQKAWEKASEFDAGDSEVGKYEMDEHEYPRELEKYGFRNVTVKVFTVVDYCPDSADVDRGTALKQINCRRNSDLASVRKILNRAPGALSPDELARLTSLINSRWDERIAKYERGVKAWDFSTSTVLAVSGVK